MKSIVALVATGSVMFLTGCGHDDDFKKCAVTATDAFKNTVKLATEMRDASLKVCEEAEKTRK